MDNSEYEEAVIVIFRKIDSDAKRGIESWTVRKSNNNSYVISCPNSDSLISLFLAVQNNKQLKNDLISLISKSIIESPETAPNALYCRDTTCFYSLIKLGLTDVALDSFRKRKQDAYGLITMTQYILNEDRAYFNGNQLEQLLVIIEKAPTYYICGDRSIIINKIIDDRFVLINKKLKGVDVEINQDQKTVTEKINYLNFDEKYNELLREIDKYINTETSEVLNSGMISNLRVFMHDIIIDLAEKISDSKAEEIPASTQTPVGNARNYLRKELKLSDNDNKLINAFVDILHDEGGHSFTSNKEYFRLARNIAIEITLLLLSKYEKLDVV
jgi:hypothetical protein